MLAVAPDGDRIDATHEDGSIDADPIFARSVGEPLLEVDDRVHRGQLGAEPPVGPLLPAEAMRREEVLAPAHRVERVVFRISGLDRMERRPR
jgi:hypothetical protein